MKKRFLVAGIVVMGISMELLAAPAKLAVTPMKAAVAPTKPVAAPAARAVVTPAKAPVAPVKAVVTPAKPVVVPARSDVAATEGSAGAKSKPLPEAEPSAGGVGLTVKVGTLGGGLEATVGANDYLGFRFGVNMMSAGPSISRDEGTITTDLDWLSYGALVDLHVFGSGFRVTGGGLINKNKFKLKADLTDSVSLDGQDYYLSDLSGQVTFSELAPYFGIGYGNAVGADGNWHFACDFGIMFQGEPKVAASATASNPSIQPYVDDALSREVAKIQDDASAFKYYPVISIGVSYKF